MPERNDDFVDLTGAYQSPTSRDQDAAFDLTAPAPLLELPMQPEVFAWCLLASGHTADSFARWTGFNASNVSQWRRGKRNIPDVTAVRLYSFAIMAQAMGISFRRRHIERGAENRPAEPDAP